MCWGWGGPADFFALSQLSLWASVRRSAVAQTPRDQETGLGDIELREAGLHFDESAVYPARPSVFSGNQVAARDGRNLTLGSDE